jgi:hypothetical protein
METRPNLRGFLSPKALGPLGNIGSLTPQRGSNTFVGGGSKGIRIVESGELRVVQKAAKRQWDFARDNVIQLKQHVADLRFGKPALVPPNLEQDNALLVKIGLTKIHNPSMEELPRTSSEQTNNSIFQHSLRDGAPRNKLGIQHPGSS